MKVYSRLLVVATFFITLPAAFAGSELVMYSSKNSSFLQPLLNEYSSETGVPVSFLVAPTDELIARLEIEGNASKADLILATGASHFELAAKKGLFATVESRDLEKNIPEHLQSPDNQWFSFFKRARTIIYNPEKISDKELTGYAGLAEKKWKGKLCLRSAQAEYTQSLVAMLIQNNGVGKSKEIVQGWVNNLAAEPFADDQQIVDAIEQGICDVGIVNSYYYARLKRTNADTKLKLFWADQKGNGVHMNITAMAVTSNAPNKAQAIDLMEWLTSKPIQSMYAGISMEYPVNEKVYPAREVARWGRFKEDQTPLSHAGQNRPEAIALLKEAGHH